MSFRLKVIFGIALIEVVLLTTLVISSIYYLKSSNEQQFEERAATSVRLLASMTTDAIIALDIATLDAMVAESLNNADIAYVRVLDRDDRPLVEGGDRSILARLGERGRGRESVGDWIDVSHPVSVAGARFGTIDLGIRTESLETTISDASRWMITVALSEILLVAVFGYLLGRILTRQLADIREGAKAIADGWLGFQIKVRGDDELADTARLFNRMSESLKSYSERLEEARAEAEARRTYAETALQDAISSLSEGTVIIDAEGSILQINEAFEKQHPHVGATAGIRDIDELNRHLCSGIVAEQAGKPTFDGQKEDDAMTGKVAEVRGLAMADEAENWTATLGDGEVILYSVSEMSGGGRVFVTTDVTSIYEAESRVRRFEWELLQRQKLEAIGTLAGGIAHELNTPIQFVGDNLDFVEESSAELIRLAEHHRKLVDALKAGSEFEASELDAYAEALREADFDFLREEVPSALRQSADGVSQMANIVRAMKEFSHPATKEKSAVDVNHVLERATVVARSEWKYVAEIEWRLSGNPLYAYAVESDLNQVFLNLIVNAVHAITDAGRDRGRIRIGTWLDGDRVLVEIGDNGTGIPPEVQDRIYEQFFTTKDVGRGTGQGLALSRELIVNKNDGEIRFETRPGEGTTFIVELPVAGANARARSDV